MTPEEEARDQAYRKELQERDVRQKKFEAVIRTATDEVVREVAGARPPLFSEFTHWFYGSTGIHPKHLAIWFIFSTDSESAEAERTGLTTRIGRLTREKLLRHGYPAEVLEEIHVGFVSDETVKREAGGSYFHYFK